VRGLSRSRGVAGDIVAIECDVPAGTLQGGSVSDAIEHSRFSVGSSHLADGLAAQLDLWETETVPSKDALNPLLASQATR
jgi:hypothetical protein